MKELGADVGVKNGQGNTPLHVAARVGSASVARLMLDFGAEKEATNEDGAAPLYLAVR